MTFSYRGELVYDSGESMEAFMLEYFSAYHNADDGASAERDKRSSSKVTRLCGSCLLLRYLLHNV